MQQACRLFLIFLVGLAGFGFPHPAAAAIEVQLVAGGLDFLVGLEHAGDQSDRLFLVQQSGKILLRSSDSESLRTVGILESFPLQFRPPEIQNHTR